MHIILNFLNDIDTSLFLFLNGIHSPTWDIVFSFITSKTSWIPLYVLLLLMIAFKFKRKTIFIGFFIGLLFAMGDQISVKLFKDVFERLRPCHNPEINYLVHTINGKCGAQFGFVSSHATNSFALAVFTGFLLKNQYKYLSPILLFWAAVVSYSRVYVGVHYPGDIICGGVLGTVVAIFVFYLLKWSVKKFNVEIKLDE